MATKPAPRAKKGQMVVSNWFKRPDSELVCRREDVWTLLGWYHTTVVQPQLGFRGAFRRLWWQITGRSRKLESPWQEIHKAIEVARSKQAVAKRNGTQPKVA